MTVSPGDSMLKRTVKEGEPSGYFRFRGSLWLVASILVFSLVGCATTPPRAPGVAAAWLGGKPRVVVRIDAAQVTAWGQVTKNREELKAVGNRTQIVWLGFELEHLDDLRNAADTMRVVLEGDFPKAAAGLMLDFNGSWKKESDKAVWTNPRLALSISLPEDGLVTVRRHDPALAAPSEGVLRDLDPAALVRTAVWVSFWDPGQALFGTTGAKLLPVERMDVILNAGDGGLEGPVVLRFSDERAARAAAVLLKLFSSQIRARLGQDLDWTVEGSQIVGATLRIKQEDLKVLAEKLVADPVPPEDNP